MSDNHNTNQTPEKKALSGDALDHNSGVLMAKAPEIREAAFEALKAITDVLSGCDILSNQSRYTLERAADILRKAIK